MITLKTLPQATAQEVFDQVVTHLLTQNEKCEGFLERCKYRHNDLKCAAGCLISDEEYDEGMEDKEWGGLITLDYVPSEHGNLIEDLQHIHDSDEVEDWYNELEVLANKFQLEFNPPKN